MKKKKIIEKYIIEEKWQEWMEWIENGKWK